MHGTDPDHTDNVGRNTPGETVSGEYGEVARLLPAPTPPSPLPRKKKIHARCLVTGWLFRDFSLFVLRRFIKPG